MSIFLKVLHLTFSVTFFLPFKFVNIITKAQKAFESKYSWKEFFIMANRIMLNQTSYHGAGAIQEIANEAKAHGFKKGVRMFRPGSRKIQGYRQSNRHSDRKRS